MSLREYVVEVMTSDGNMEVHRYPRLYTQAN